MVANYACWWSVVSRSSMSHVPLLKDVSLREDEVARHSKTTVIF
jgi:hypothetical protein